MNKLENSSNLASNNDFTNKNIMDIVNSISSVEVKQNELVNNNINKVVKEASVEELKELLCKGSISQYSKIHGLLDMHIRYNIFEGTPTKFFTPVGDNESSLIVVFPVCERQSGPQMLDLHWDVHNGIDIDIQDYLSSLPGINWNKPISISGTSTIVLEKIKHILESPGLCGKPQTMTVVFDGDIYSSECGTESVTTSIPCGYALGQLKPEHASYVSKMFGNPHGESDEFVASQFTKLPSVALYKILADGEKDNLPLSWTSVRSQGLIGRTFTIPDFRCKGFATAVTSELIKKILDAGFVPKVGISRSNSVSIVAHEKLGFIKRERAVRAIFNFH